MYICDRLARKVDSTLRLYTTDSFVYVLHSSLFVSKAPKAPNIENMKCKNGEKCNTREKNETPHTNR